MLIYLQEMKTEKDRRRFERIYSRYRKLMANVALEILGSRADAEDAVHRAFMQIAKDMSGISDVCSTRTRSYVCIVTRRIALNMAKERERTVCTDPEVFCAPEETEPLAERIADAVLELPPEQRDMFFLKYYHGYSIKEIAKMYGKKYDAVQRTLYNAKLAIAEELGIDFKEGKK